VPDGAEPQLVLCGDPNQRMFPSFHPPYITHPAHGGSFEVVGSILTSDHARAEELDVSLLEHLLEREVYRPRVGVKRAVTNLVKVPVWPLAPSP
jgi:hypothetical protein